MLRAIVYGLSVLLVAGSILLITYFQKTKPYVDLFANHATLVGLMLGVAGFVLTIWTLFDGLRANREAQEQVQSELEGYQAESRRILDNIRSHTFREACEQAYACLDQSKQAVRSRSGLRAIEKADEARKIVNRVLNFDDLIEAERTSLRAHLMNFRDTIIWFGPKRKLGGEPEFISDMLKHITLLHDELDQIRSRLNNELMGNINVIANTRPQD